MRHSLKDSLERRFRTPQFVAAYVCICLLPLCSLFLPLPALAADFQNSPVVRILYTADTLGHIHPCRTCGDASQGGLARRTALLKTYAATWEQPLILAGPNEFYSDTADPLPGTADSLAPILHAAFGSMPYTAVYLGPVTTADWRSRKFPPLPNGQPVADQPVTRVFPVGMLTVACVFLPPGAHKDGSPSPDQILAAQRAAREARSTAKLVIAISPWGIQAENNLASAFSGYYDILLGGGKGIAVPGQATGDTAFPGPLWLRSDRRGRAVNELVIHSLPVPGTAWIEGVHFSSRLLFLDRELPQDNAVLDLIRHLDPAVP